MTFGLSAGALAAIGGTIGGALVGGSKGANSTGTTTTDKAPWSEAQPWIKQNIGFGQQLQDFYQQNPFSAQQKTAMQNQVGDVDQFRQSTLPGLLAMANKASTDTYKRQRGGAVGSGGGYGGPVQQGGLIAGGQGPFTAPTGGLFGAVDFDAMNPFKVKK